MLRQPLSGSCSPLRWMTTRYTPCCSCCVRELGEEDSSQGFVACLRDQVAAAVGREIEQTLEAEEAEQKLALLRLSRQQQQRNGGRRVAGYFRADSTFSLLLRARCCRVSP